MHRFIKQDWSKVRVLFLLVTVVHNAPDQFRKLFLILPSSNGRCNALLAWGRQHPTNASGCAFRATNERRRFKNHIAEFFTVPGIHIGSTSTFVDTYFCEKQVKIDFFACDKKTVCCLFSVTVKEEKSRRGFNRAMQLILTLCLGTVGDDYIATKEHSASNQEASSQE